MIDPVLSRAARRQRRRALALEALRPSLGLCTDFGGEPSGWMIVGAKLYLAVQAADDAGRTYLRLLRSWPVDAFFELPALNGDALMPAALIATVPTLPTRRPFRPRRIRAAVVRQAERLEPRVVDRLRQSLPCYFLRSDGDALRAELPAGAEISEPRPVAGRPCVAFASRCRISGRWFAYEAHAAALRLALAR